MTLESELAFYLSENPACNSRVALNRKKHPHWMLFALFTYQILQANKLSDLN